MHVCVCLCLCVCKYASVVFKNGKGSFPQYEHQYITTQNHCNRSRMGKAGRIMANFGKLYTPTRGLCECVVNSLTRVV